MCFLAGSCFDVAVLVVAVRRVVSMFRVIAAHAHGGTHWDELGDDGGVSLVADGCVPRVVNVVADGDHDVCGRFGGERCC